MTALIALVANVTLFVLKQVFTVVLQQNVSDVQRESFALLFVITMIPFNVTYLISHLTFAAIVKCKKNKAYYSAHKANAAHHKSIRDAHSGVRLRRLCTGNVDLREFSQSLNISTVKAIRLRISIPSQKPIPTFQSLRWIP